MEKRGKLIVGLAWLGMFTLSTATASMANVLANPGFEANASAGQAATNVVSGWTLGGPANSALTSSQPPDPVHSGVGSLQLTANGGFSVPVAWQTFVASPGQTWDFQGFGLVTNVLPANATFGLLKIIWDDASTNDLQAGTVLIGTGVGPANPGIESAHVDSTTTPNTWKFMEAEGVAPANTAFVRLFVLNVDQSAAKIWFDDLNAVLVPEPSTIGMALTGLLGLVVFGWKKPRS